MAVIALNWELGADLGHVGRLLPIAEALRQRGHEPVFIIRDISRAEPSIGSAGFEYLQAPVWTSAVSGLPEPTNFTDTLLRFGYLDRARADVDVPRLAVPVAADQRRRVRRAPAGRGMTRVNGG